MKANRKIITNRPKISNSEILKQKQPFKELIKNYYSASFAGGSGFSSFLGWGIGGLTLLTVATVIYFSEMSPSENLNEKVVVQQNDSLAHEGVVEPEITYERSIKPPYADKIHYENYRVRNNRKPRTITTKNGSIIHLPAKAFVDENGKEVSKNIRIKYRDFYNPLEFYLSGIPMDYDSAGVNYTFTSAGMFEINAMVNGKKLYLKEGKKIDIDLVSNEESTYNFYNYDTLNNEWAYQYSESPKDITKVEMNDSQNSTATIAQSSPNNQISIMKPVENSDSTFDTEIQMDINAQTIVSNVDKGNLEVREPINYSFSADKEMLKNTRYEGINSLMLEIDTKQKFDPTNYSVVWDKVELVERDTGLFIQLTKDKIIHAYAVKPVVSLADYNKAVKDYEKTVEIRKSQTKKAKKRQQGRHYISEVTNNWAVTRRIQVTNLGLFNCDSPLPRPLFAQAGTRYIKDDQGNRLYYNQLYVAQLGQNALWQYPSNQPWYYSNQLENIAWFTTQNGDLAIIYPDKFSTKNNDKFMATIYNTKEGINHLYKMIN